jgi:hypothetical protein
METSSAEGYRRDTKTGRRYCRPSQNMRKALPFFGIVLLIAIGAWVYYTPYLALRSMRSAAEAGDGAALSGYVDFPAVRESLKTTVNAKVASVASAAQDTGNPLGMFGAAFASALVSPMIDTFVTPESLALILNGVKPEPGGSVKVALPSEKDVETTTRYDGPSTFLVTVKTKGSSAEPIGLVLRRGGLVSWKLSALTFP